MDETREEMNVEEVTAEPTPPMPPFDFPAAAGAPDPTPSETDKKIDKAADVFVATVITILQLLAAAVLVCFGFSATPAVSFTAWSVLKTFCLLLGIKFVVAGYSTKKF